MKQMITPKQLSELTHDQKMKLHSLWIPDEGDHYVWYSSKKSVSKEIYMVRTIHDTWSDQEASPQLFALPLMVIGRMIELIMRKEDKYNTDGLYINFLKLTGVALYDGFRNVEDGLSDTSSLELCDALWGTIKNIL